MPPRRRLLWLIVISVTFGSQPQPGLSRTARVWNLSSGRASLLQFFHLFHLPVLALRGGLHSAPTFELPGDSSRLGANRGQSAHSGADFVLKCALAIDPDPDNARLAVHTARASALRLMRRDRLTDALHDAQQAKLLAQALSERLQKLELKIVGMTQAGLSLKQRSGEFIKTIDEIRSTSARPNTSHWVKQNQEIHMTFQTALLQQQQIYAAIEDLAREHQMLARAIDREQRLAFKELSDARSAAAALRSSYFSPRLPHVVNESASSHWHDHHSGAAAARSFSPRVPHLAANSTNVQAHDHRGRGAGLRSKKSVSGYYSPRVPLGLS